MSFYSFLLSELRTKGEVSFRACPKGCCFDVLFSKVGEHLSNDIFTLQKYNGTSKLVKHEVGFVAKSIEEAYVNEFGSLLYFQQLCHILCDDKEVKDQSEFIKEHCQDEILRMPRYCRKKKDEQNNEENAYKEEIRKENKEEIEEEIEKAKKRIERHVDFQEDRETEESDYYSDYEYYDDSDDYYSDYEYYDDSDDSVKDDERDAEWKATRQTIAKHIFEFKPENPPARIEKSILTILRANFFDVQVMPRQIDGKEYQMIYVRKSGKKDYEPLAYNGLFWPSIDRTVLFECAVEIGARYYRLTQSGLPFSLARAVRSWLVRSNTASMCEWIADTVGIAVRMMPVSRGRFEIHYLLSAYDSWQFHSCNDSISTRKEACKSIVHSIAFCVLERLSALIESRKLDNISHNKCGKKF